MKINIVGGGPAGLYFAILMREIAPEAVLNIWERDPPDESHGWGIVLNRGTLDLLSKCDPISHAEIVNSAKSWGSLDIFLKGRKLSLHGHPYISIPRILMLKALRERCQELDIEIRYRHPVRKIEDVTDCDLLVGADGANSVVRNAFENEFKPSIDIRDNRYIWLGTNKLFDTFTMMFRKPSSGVLAAEAYPYSDAASTFIAQCTSAAWDATGLSDMTVDQSCEYVASVFESELDGHSVLPNPSARWNQFPIVTNQNWVCDGVLLLGDALHTAHFSTGSGTRLAMEDAIAAARCLSQNSDINAALQDFSSQREPIITRFQAVALESELWYERLDEVIDLDLLPFAFSALTRSKSVDLRTLKFQDPQFVADYLQWRQDNEEQSA